MKILVYADQNASQMVDRKQAPLKVFPLSVALGGRCHVYAYSSVQFITSKKIKIRIMA